MRSPTGRVRPGAVRRAFLVAACAALTATVSACQSTEQESARIGREGKQLTGAAAALKLGAPNRSVAVSDVTLLSDAGRSALAVKLTATSARPQSRVPILVTVTGKGGKVLFSNEAGGAEASLQHIGLLVPHQSAWWVDDQVLTNQSGGSAKVRVGTGATPPAGSPPALATTGVHTSQQAGINVLSGTLVNRSARAQNKVPVFVVALRGGTVVAAGKAVVASLAAHQGASAPFQIFLVGNPAGATLQLSAVPSA
jgi:hypothetical protein